MHLPQYPLHYLERFPLQFLLMQQLQQGILLLTHGTLETAIREVEAKPAILTPRPELSLHSLLLPAAAEAQAREV